MTRTQGLSDLLDLYRPIWLFSGALLLTLFCSRAALIATHWDRVSAVADLTAILIQGLRFDLIVLFAILALPLVGHPFFCQYHVWRKILTVSFAAAYGLVLLMEAATPTFISEFDLRPNILFVEYLKYPREVLTMLWRGYKAPVSLGIFTTGALMTGFYRLLSGRQQMQSKPGLSLAIGLVLLSLFACTLGIRSSLGHRPANPSVLAFTNDLLVNDLMLSSAYSVAYASYSAIRHERSVRAYGSMTPEEALEQVRQGIALPADHFSSVELPTLHHEPAHSPLAERPNLVIVLEESLGAEFVGALGGLDLTPNLDALFEEGIWFGQLYATGTRSVRGIEAIVTGFTPTPARSVAKLPKAQHSFFSLAEVLKRNGYETSFIYGGEAHFDNMRQFLVGNGVETVIEEKDFSNPTFKGSWGVSDEDLLQRAHQEFDKPHEKPFFSLVFTSSNHSPFEFPDDRITLHSQPKQQVNNAVKYADYALGEFFKLAKNSSYWDNTLFLVIADHNSRVWGDDLVPIERFHIPALVVGGPVEPSKVDRLASQIDIIPTLLGMMGISTPIPTFGVDLFRPDIESLPRRAVMQYDKTQAYMQGDQVVVMKLDQPPVLYQRTPNGLTPATENDQNLIDRAVGLATWSSYAYQNQLYRLPGQ